MTSNLLVASPQMNDPFFERTVVLMWHHDEEGAVGVVINRALGHMLPDVISDAEDLDLAQYADSEVSWGGPVESMSGTLVARAPIADEDGWELEHGVSITRSQDTMISLLRAKAQLMLCLGYAGWGPMQLDDEIAAGGWLWADVDPALVFDTPLDERWERALASLGLSSNTIWMPSYEA